MREQNIEDRREDPFHYGACHHKNQEIDMLLTLYLTVDNENPEVPFMKGLSVNIPTGT